MVTATQKALARLDQLERPVAALHVRQLGHMKRAELTELLPLLERAREARET